jgi:transcriptional regulator with XRE-family HTH domain
MAKKAYRDSFVVAHASNTVASQIAALRQERGWTQTELAERAGMRQSRISALEDPNNENFEAKTLFRLASAFDVGVIIRFAPYSDIARWASNISATTLVVRPFAEDSIDDLRDVGAGRSLVADIVRAPDRQSILIRGNTDSSWLIERVPSETISVLL